mgnify:CR=1 FL=1
MIGNLRHLTLISRIRRTVNAPTASRRGLRCNGLKSCSDQSSAEGFRPKSGSRARGPRVFAHASAPLNSASLSQADSPHRLRMPRTRRDQRSRTRQSQAHTKTAARGQTCGPGLRRGRRRRSVYGLPGVERSWVWARSAPESGQCAEGSGGNSHPVCTAMEIAASLRSSQ